MDCYFSSFCKMKFSCPGGWQLPREPPLQRNPPMWWWEMCMVHSTAKADQRWFRRVIGKIITPSATACRHCAAREFESSSAWAFRTIQEQFSTLLVKWTEAMSSISVSFWWLKPTPVCRWQNYRKKEGVRNTTLSPVLCTFSLHFISIRSEFAV